MTIRHLYPAVEPSLNLDFANSKKLDSRITFTRGSTATYTDESGIIRTAAANEARFDHDSDGNSLGLLIEESRTNSFLYSESFNVYWNTSGTIQPNASSAPDNTSSATLVTPLSGTFFVRQAPSGTGTATSSVFVKDAGAGSCAVAMGSSSAGYLINVNLVTGEFISGRSYGGGTLVGYTIQPVSGGWYRISVAATASSRGINILRADGTTPTQGIYIWGAVLELGASFPTSYIPTSGSTVTRSADVASMTGTNFSSWYNQGEGSFVASADRVDALPSLQFTVLTTNGFRLPEFLFTSSGNGRVFNNIAGSYTTPAALTRATFGWSFDGTGASRAINGAGNSVATSLTDTNTILYIGNWLNSNNYRHNGHLSRIAYYPVRLPDATLQALTL